MAELISYVTTRHRCPHCPKHFAVRGTALRHVERCFLNPERRTCLTCVHRKAGSMGEPDCAISEGAWPCCAECGNSRRDYNNEHDCGHRGSDANYLQVLCPSWNRPAERQET